MSRPTIQVGKPFTFTPAEEGEITTLLRQAQRALWIRNDGYRVFVCGAVTRINRIISGALNRSHGVESDAPPQIPQVPPTVAD